MTHVADHDLHARLDMRCGHRRGAHSHAHTHTHGHSVGSDRPLGTIVVGIQVIRKVTTAPHDASAHSAHMVAHHRRTESSATHESSTARHESSATHKAASTATKRRHGSESVLKSVSEIGAKTTT
jgi:hypothetical protein